MCLRRCADLRSVGEDSSCYLKTRSIGKPNVRNVGPRTGGIAMMRLDGERFTAANPLATNDARRLAKWGGPEFGHWTCATASLASIETKADQWAFDAESVDSKRNSKKVAPECLPQRYPDGCGCELVILQPQDRRGSSNSMAKIESSRIGENAERDSLNWIRSILLSVGRPPTCSNKPTARRCKGIPVSPCRITEIALRQRFLGRRSRSCFVPELSRCSIRRLETQYEAEAIQSIERVARKDGQPLARKYLTAINLGRHPMNARAGKPLSHLDRSKHWEDAAE